MKKPSFRAARLACALLFAGVASSHAEYLVYRGTTAIRWERLSYVASSGATETRGSEKQHEIYIYSSLSSTGYARYTLDIQKKVATKTVGNFSQLPMQFAGYRGGVRERHDQLNGSWTQDIPEVADTEDIFNVKTGDFGGIQSQVLLPTSGSSVQAARKLSGFHTHTSWSENFGIDSRPGFGYIEGRFHQVSNSRSTFKLDLPLTDQAKVLGGSLANAIQVTESYLLMRNFTIVNGPPLPF